MTTDATHTLDEQLEQFHREGFLVVPDAIALDLIERLLAGVQRAFEAPPREDIIKAYGGLTNIWRPMMFERGPEFEELVDNPRLIDLIEAILGRDCHLIANSALCTSPGNAIDSWHFDEAVRFPIPRGLTLDPRIEMPCLVLGLNYYLCDVDEELGPTEFVPGSHRSGRGPEAEDRDENGTPIYEGRTPVTTPGKAGTAILWHDQTWHRGGPNRSDGRLRWVQQSPYGKRYIAQRFYPFVNYHMPEAVLERANPHRKRLLGVHPAGAYG